MSERRKHRRVSFKLRALVDLGPETAPVEAHMMDISEGGAFFLATTPVADGRQVVLRFLLGGTDECEAVGFVLRAMPSGIYTGLALQFSVANDTLLNFARNLAACPEPNQHAMIGEISSIVLALR